MKPREKKILGVLNRMAAYEKAREGKESPKSIRAEIDIDRKMLWRWRMVSNT